MALVSMAAMLPPAFAWCNSRQPVIQLIFLAGHVPLAPKEFLEKPCGRHGASVCAVMGALLGVTSGKVARRQQRHAMCQSGRAHQTQRHAMCQSGRAHQMARAAEKSGTWDGNVGEKVGEDFFPETAEQPVEVTGELLQSDPPMRIGHGYDIHKYLPRDNSEGWGKYEPQPTVIGGVVFDDFELGVVAHSDGDVVYHSVTDAILGALGLPDLGQFFPDTSAKWRGANSKEFFNEAVRLMELRKYRISNVDVTVIAEKPRLAARKPEMKANVVQLGHTVPARVNIKARTHEKLDSVGECRAIECHVVVLLELCN